MNEFVRDNECQRRLRDKILAPLFYGKYALDGRYVTVDKGRMATILQKRYAVDTIVQRRDGGAISIEEKIVRWPKTDRPYTAFALETKSCTVAKRESPGWMFYGQADYLLYCFANRAETQLDCYLIDFPQLQDWFWPRHTSYPVSVTEQCNRTECRIVPIAEVCGSVPTWRRCIGYEAECAA
jgi:hypothetical protein